MKIETWAYGPVEKETVGEALATERVVKVTPNADGAFQVLEMCDEWAGAILTREQLRAWAHELLAMADAPPSNNPGQTPEGRSPGGCL